MTLLRLSLALDNPDRAFANGDESAVPGNFIADGELERALELCVLQRILASLNFYTLDDGIGGNERKIAIVGAGNERAGAHKEAGAVVPVDHHGVNTAQLEVFQHGEVGKLMIHASAESADDGDIIRTAGNGDLGGKLGVRKILFGLDT